jgi:uncharacterized membrane protein YfcA
MQWFAVVLIGVAVGFFAGLFGKGGSAIATPLLRAVGFPAIVAVAAPLPATIPSTLAASWPYWRRNFIDGRVLRWSLAFGVPATAAGALATRWIGGGFLVKATDLIIVGLGFRFATRPGAETEDNRTTGDDGWRRAIVATVVGLTSGLLANGGGFLLVPLYLAVLRLPIKTAFATSLSVASVLAVPGTIVHAALGHIDWALVFVFAAASVPLANLGSRVALRSNPVALERIYGFALISLGAVFFVAIR